MSASNGSLSSGSSGNTEKGVRGFELFAHLQLGREHSAQELSALLAELESFGLCCIPYSGQRALGLHGPLPAEFAGWLQGKLASGAFRYAEVGLRGYLRKGESTEWMPWRRNAVQERLSLPAFEQGVRYVLE